MILEKHPLLAVDRMPLEIWYEGPRYMVVEKPEMMPLHPLSAEGRGTLVNALLQTNRWLAEMENSVAPGVIHRLRPQDRGLILMAKDDATALILREAHANQQLHFRFRVLVPQGVEVGDWAGCRVVDRKAYGDKTVYDIDSVSGDTAFLAEAWLDGAESLAEFICYQIELLATHHVVAMARRIPLPDLDLYTAPT